MLLNAADSLDALNCWTIQMGAYSEAAHASKRLARLDNPLCHLSSDLKRYRITCGCFNTPELARQSIGQWKAIDPGAFVTRTPAANAIIGSKKPVPTAADRDVAMQEFELDESISDSAVTSPHITVADSAINQREIEFFVQDPLAAQSAFSLLKGVEKANVLRRRPSERIPETEFSVELFGRLLTIGGELSVETEARRNFAFATEPDDLDREKLELELELFYAYSDYSAAFVEIKGKRQSDEEPEINEKETESQWSRGEMWIFTGGWFDDTTGIQMGRQNFADDREWWWDKNLDAVRVHYDTKAIHAEIGIAQELARVSSTQDRIDPEEDEVFRMISNVTWMRNKDQETGIFILIQRDNSDTEIAGEIVMRDLRDKSDLDAVWTGWREQGKYRLVESGRIYYWFDLGLVAGTENIIDYDTIDAQHSLVDSVDRRDVRAAGLDVGASWKTSHPGQMTISFGYAVGSGDRDLNDNTDTAYRQTGLQGNEDKFRGVTGFHYYGELLRPELSNIAITTLGLGFHFLPESSIDLVYHSYQQLEASDEIRGSRLDLNPEGGSTEIGSELDLIVGVEEWKNLELELVLARFKAGDAFGGLKGEVASKLSLELSYRF